MTTIVDGERWLMAFTSEAQASHAARKFNISGGDEAVYIMMSKVEHARVRFANWLREGMTTVVFNASSQGIVYKMDEVAEPMLVQMDRTLAACGKDSQSDDPGQ